MTKRKGACLSEDGVLLVKVWGGAEGDEELAPILIATKGGTRDLEKNMNNRMLERYKVRRREKRSDHASVGKAKTRVDLILKRLAIG